MPDLERLGGLHSGFFELRLGLGLLAAVQEGKLLEGALEVVRGHRDRRSISTGKQVPTKQRDEIGERPPQLGASLRITR